MKLIRSDRCKDDFKRLPKHLQRRTEKALHLFAENLRHPSLRAKKMEGQLDTEGREIWEARVTKAYRFTFVIDRDTYILRRVGPHEEALRKP